MWIQLLLSPSLILWSLEVSPSEYPEQLLQKKKKKSQDREYHGFPSMLFHPSWLNCSSSCRLSPIPLPSSTASWAEISFPCLSKSTHMPDWVLLCLTFLFWTGSGIQELPGKHTSMIQPCRSCFLTVCVSRKESRRGVQRQPRCAEMTLREIKHHSLEVGHSQPIAFYF